MFSNNLFASELSFCGPWFGVVRFAVFVRSFVRFAPSLRGTRVDPERSGGTDPFATKRHEVRQRFNARLAEADERHLRCSFQLRLTEQCLCGHANWGIHEKLMIALAKN